MKLTLMLLILSLFQKHSFAQHDSAHKQLFILNWSPLALVDINDGPAVRIGTEYKTQSRIGVGIDAKWYPYIRPNPEWVSKIEIKGYAIMPAIKYYLNGKRNRTKRYLSLQYTYKNLDYARTDSITVAPETHVYKRYRMHQYMNALSMSYGEMYNSKSGWVIEPYAGIGIRFIKATSNLPNGEEVYNYHDWTTDMTFIPNTRTGHSIYPTICLGVKIGYRFL